MTIAVGKAAEVDLTFKDAVREHSGEDVHGCYYCQKCTAGCPTAYAMDYKPAQLLRMIQLGQKDQVLGSKAIWMCVACETCGTRCPNHIRLAPVMDVLRQMAQAGEYKPEPAIYALHRAFLDNIKLLGRVYEVGLVAEFKALSFFQGGPEALFRGLIPDIKMGAGIFFKGKFGLIPERVKRMEEVKKLYEEAARESG
ncbi:MAG: heterodisulfide reductase [Chloroflexi bacterium]|nr:heterodisulfide reductase [Chloroflexota bacterium]